MASCGWAKEWVINENHESHPASLASFLGSRCNAIEVGEVAITFTTVVVKLITIWIITICLTTISEMIGKYKIDKIK